MTLFVTGATSSKMQQGFIQTLDPFAVRITDTLGIRWYGLSYLLGFLICYAIVYWLARRQRTEIHPSEAGDFIFAVALGTVIGGRLGYCVFYSPGLFLDFTSSPPFWGVLAVNHGGMASHGGIIGIITACFLFGRKRHVSVLHLMDLCALCAGPGIFFGRIANFVNGELVGREAPSWLPWAVRFPQDILLWPTYEPQRLLSLAPAVQQLGISPDKWNAAVGALPSPGPRNFVINMLPEILDAVHRGNRAVIDAIAPVLTLRHPSQLYEALLEGLLVFIALLFIWRKPRKPGVISGCFLVLYAAVRIFGEQFRMPDAQIGFQWLGLTRGQWLSIAMITFSIGCFIYWARRPVQKIGGWASE